MKVLLAFLTACLLAAPAFAADEPPALATLRHSAEQGSRDAQLELGILYECGCRMPDNLGPALAWYMRAADQGSEKAAKRRDVLLGSMKPDEVEQAKKLADEIAAKQPPSPTTAPATQAPAPAEPAAAAEPPSQTAEPAPAGKAAEPKPQ